LIDRNLCVVILLEARIGGIFHNARLRVSKVVLIIITRSWHRRTRWAATCATPCCAFSFRTLRQPGLIVLLLGCLTLPGTSFQHRFGFRKPHQAILPPGNLLAHDQPIGHLSLVHLFTQGEEFLNLCSELDLQLSQTLVTDRFVPGSIRMDFCSIQADRAQCQHTRLLCEQEHLHEELFEFRQKGASERGQRIVVGMQVPCDETERHRLIRRAFDFARTEYSSCIAIQEQAQQHFRSIGFSTTRAIVGIQGRKVQQSHAVYHEAGQMVGRKTVSQAYGQIKRLSVVHLFECSTHAQKYTITDGEAVLLSDKLLAYQ
jgi:hypothetical protein